MEKDYLVFECSEVSNDRMYVSMGEKLCIECCESDTRSAVTLDRFDIERLIPYLLKYYYSIES